MRLEKLFFNAVTAGPLLGFGFVLIVLPTSFSDPPVLACSPPLNQPRAMVSRTRPRCVRTFGALMFSIGKLAGMLFFMAIIIVYGGTLTDIPAYRDETVTFVMQKAHDPGWQEAFLRAIGANCLVCLVAFLSISAREIGSKILTISFPTATFVALAMNHVVDNMFFITMRIWNGAPFGVGYYIWESMLPTALGNMVGGGFFVGTIYWYLYLPGERDVEVSFNT